MPPRTSIYSAGPLPSLFSCPGLSVCSACRESSLWHPPALRTRLLRWISRWYIDPGKQTRVFGTKGFERRATFWHDIHVLATVLVPSLSFGSRHLHSVCHITRPACKPLESRLRPITCKTFPPSLSQCVRPFAPALVFVLETSSFLFIF